MKKLLILLLPTLFLSGCFSYSAGEKVGIPTKLGYEGIFCHNRVASIVRGGFIDSSGANGGQFDFFITNSEAAKVFSDALNNDKQVKIFYRRDYFLISICLKQNSYVVDRVEEVGAKPKDTSLSLPAPTPTTRQETYGEAMARGQSQ